MRTVEDKPECWGTLLVEGSIVEDKRRWTNNDAHEKVAEVR